MSKKMMQQNSNPDPLGDVVENVTPLDAGETINRVIDRIEKLPNDVRQQLEFKIASSDRGGKSHSDGTIEFIPAKVIVTITSNSSD